MISNREARQAGVFAVFVNESFVRRAIADDAVVLGLEHELAACDRPEQAVRRRYEGRIFLIPSPSLVAARLLRRAAGGIPVARIAARRILARRILARRILTRRILTGGILSGRVLPWILRQDRQRKRANHERQSKP